MEVIKLRLRDLRRPDQAPGLYDLTRSPVRVGRGPRCEIRLHTDDIADVQVILRREGDHWCLHPVGPTQGCRTASGWLLETLVLASGNIFEIGHVAFEFDPAPETQQQASESLTLTPELHLGDLQTPSVNSPVNTTPDKPVEKPGRVAPVPVVNELALARAAHASDFLASASASVNSVRPLLKKQVAATGTTDLIANDSQKELGEQRRIRSELKPAASRLADHSTTELPRARSESFKLKSHNQSILNEIASVIGSNSNSNQISRNIKRNELAATTSVAQTLSQWTSGTTSASRQIPVRHGVSAILPGDISENALNLSPIPRLSRLFTARDLPADTIAFESTTVSLINEIEATAADLPELQSIETGEIKHEVIMPSLVVATTADLTGVNGIVIDSADTVPESAYVCDEEISNDIEDDTVVLHGDSALLGIAELADSVDSSMKCNQAAEFEEWLANVEPIFESIPATIDACNTTRPDEPESHESLPLGLISTEPEEGSVEMLFDASPEVEPVNETAELPSDFPRLAAVATSPPEPLAAFEPIPAESGANAVAIEPDEAAGLDTWPSVGDIMRWQAGRDGSINTGLPENPAMERALSDDSLEPAQVLKFNPALSLLVATFVGFATLAGAYLTYRTGVQDNLTQNAISAVIASARSEQPPRLPSATLNKMVQDRSWWELPADQIWWRATLMKQRENAGLEVPRASEELANRANQASPILPTARLWKLTRYPELTKAADWNSLSRDVLSLVTAADHFRRIGEHDRAKSADKSALEMVTRSDMIFDRGSLYFDSELGTNRFLLPGQHETLTILKRLIKEPNGYQLVLDVMPDGRPEVWLTAAELIERNGLGDPSPLYTRIMELEKGIPAGTSDRQRLHQAVLAEARAQKGELGISVESYQSAMAKMPESDLKRSWFYNLGELSQRDHKNEAAIAFWRKARGINPNHEVDRHAIAASRSLKTGSGLSEVTSTTLRTN